MSTDSFMQLSMAETFKFGDWHPPVMAFLWFLSDKIFPLPSGMLAIHMALLWGGIYAWCKAYKNYSLSWLLLILPFLPPILTFSGVLWKDVGLAFSLLCATGLIAQKPSKGKNLTILCLLFYATSVRHNAIFAVIPIVFFVVYDLLETRRKILFSICASILAVATLYSLNSSFEYKILKAEKQYPVNAILLDDLSYLSIKDHKSLVSAFSLDKITKCASLDIMDTQLVGRFFCLSDEKNYNIATHLEQANIKHLWVSEISTHPIDYLKFRLAAFSFLLRDFHRKPSYIWTPRVSDSPNTGFGDNHFGIKPHINTLNTSVEHIVAYSSRHLKFLFKPFFYLLLDIYFILFLFFVNKTKTAKVVQTLSLSSLFYIVGYLPTVPAADFRYIYWSVVATLLSSLLMIISWPGLRKTFSRKTLFINISLASLTVILLGHSGFFFDLNVDKDLDQIIHPKQLIPARLAYTGQEGDDDPYYVYDLPTSEYDKTSSFWIKFNFTCVGQHKDAIARISVNNIGEISPDKTAAMKILNQGTNLIYGGSHDFFDVTSPIKRLKITFLSDGACKKYAFDKVVLMKNVTYGD